MRTPSRKQEEVWLLAGALALSVLAVDAAHADSFTWTGGGDGVSWFDPNNWDNNGSPGVPDSVDDAVIDNNGGVASSVSFLGTDTITNLTITDGDSLTIGNNSFFNIGGVLNNDGLVRLDPTVNFVDIRALGSDLTFNGTGEVALNGNTTRIIDAGGSFSLFNTANHTISGFGQLGVNALGVNNAGTIDANVSGGTLFLDPDALGATNTGLMQATNGGILFFVGGSYDNIGGVIRADGDDGGGNTSTVTFGGSAGITGGVIESINGGIVQTSTAVDVFLDGVTINDNFVVRNNTDLNLFNTITNTGEILLKGNPNVTEISINNDVTFDGGGTIKLDSTDSVAQIRDEGGIKRLTLDDQTLEGTGIVGVNSIVVTVNPNGVIDSNVSGGTLVIDTTNTAPDDGGASGVTNNGLMRASNGATLFLAEGDVTNNTTIEAVGAASVVELGSQSRIVGGTLQAVDGGLVQTSASVDAFLDSVSFIGQLNVQNNTDLNVSGTINNTGDIAINPTVNTTEMSLVTDTTFAGGGTVSLNSLSIFAVASIRDEGGIKRLTLEDQTIQGTGNLGANSIVLTINEGGRVNANVNGGILLLDTTNSTPDDLGAVGVTNNGLIDATNGGILEIAEGTVTNNTLIQADGVGSVVQLNSSSVVVGGTLQSINGGVVQTDIGSTVTIADLTLNGQFDILNNTFVNVIGTINNTGDIGFKSTGNVLRLRAHEGDVIFTGGGTITLDDTIAPVVIDDTGSVRRVTLADQTVQGSGNFGENSIAITVEEGGQVNANVAGRTLVVDGSPSVPTGGGDIGVTNDGLLQATLGGKLALGAGLLTNNNVIQADGIDSIVELRSSSSVVGGTLQSINGGVIQAAAASTVTLTDLTINGELVVLNNTFLQVAGTIDNTGDILISPTGNINRLRILSDNTIFTGGGTITMDESVSPIVIDDTGGVNRLTLDDQTIQGSGQVGQNSIAITINDNGVIDSNVDGKALLVDPTPSAPDDGGATGLVSSGVIRASNGGTINLGPGDYTNLPGGTFEALNDSTFASAGNLTNLNAGVLTEGIYRSVETGDGSLLSIGGSAVDTIANGSTIVELSGVDAIARFNNVVLEDSLTNVNGTLKVLDGHDFNMANQLNNDGTVELGGAGLAGGSITSNGDILNSATAELFGHGTVNNTILNSGTVRAANGTLSIFGVIDGQSGSIAIDPGASLNLGGATGDSDADFLTHNGNDLNLGTFDILVREDYTNANFGSGNAFDGRANVTGLGEIIADGDTAQSVAGPGVADGTTATPTIDLGAVRRGQPGSSSTFTVNNDGTNGPILRGAVKTDSVAANLDDSSLFEIAGGAQDFALDNGESTSDLQVSAVAGLSETAGAQSATFEVVNNFDNIDSQTITVEAEVWQPAIPDVTPIGPVALGNFHVDDTAEQALSVTNAAPNTGGFTESLVVTSFASSGDATLNDASTGPLGPGESDNSSIIASLDTATAGAKAGSVTVGRISTGAPLPNLNLGDQTINLSGTVYRFAAPDVSDTLNLGDFHIADLAQGLVSAANTAIDDGFSEDLLAEANGVTGDVTTFVGSATINPLANSGGALVATIDTDTAGAKSGTALTALTSQAIAAGLGDTALPGASTTLTADVFALAEANVAQTSIDFGIVHVGEDVSQLVEIANTANGPAAFVEFLDATISDVGAGATASGSIDNLLVENASSISVGIDTSSAGAVSADITLDLISDPNGINSLGTTDLGQETISVEAIVNNFAEAMFVKTDGEGTFIPEDPTPQFPTVDFGQVLVGTGDQTVTLSLLNDVLGPADELSGSYVIDLDSAFSTDGFITFTGLEAGDSIDDLLITFNTDTLGDFGGAIVLNPRGSNASGYDEALDSITIDLRGEVVIPEPSSLALLGLGGLLVARRRRSS